MTAVIIAAGVTIAILDTMPSDVLPQLDRYGPDHCEPTTPDEAAAYTRDLVATQYENFSVVSALVPPRLRDDFANVYAFCRWADDLGDETGDPQRSLELLAWWQRELDDCYAGRPRHPVFVALAPTIEQHDIPIDPFVRLIDAFVQDQSVTRYKDWDQLCDYCTRSADPVGRLVLYLCGHRDAHRQHLSDATCTALQLVNFWQDVRRDIVERDRIYVPADALAAHGLTHDDLARHVEGSAPFDRHRMWAYEQTIKSLVDRTWPLFRKGAALPPLVAPDVRLPIKLFSLGGQAIMHKVQQAHYRTIDRRPTLSKAGKVALMMQALATNLLPGGLR